jgi:chaperone BCS1
LEKDVFEKVFRLEIEGQEQEILDDYIRESVYYYNQFNSEPTKAIYVYQYVDINEQWEKFNEVRKRSIHTIYLPLEQSQKVLADVRHFLLPETRSNYEKFGIPYRKTYCFYGPPGSGKTSLIHSVASEMDKNICTFRFHNSTKDLDLCNALKWIPKNSIFVLEDIDCIIKNREEIKSGVTFSGILNLLDGLSSMDCMLTFITTNHFLELDAAIKRPGRIDYILEFSYINREQIFKMLEIFYPEEKEDFEEIYKEIKGYKMTVTHLQKFLFSLYPQGKVKKNINKFIQEYLKYYEVNESKLYI